MPTLVAVDEDRTLVVGERASAWPERSVVRSVKSALLNRTTSIPVTTRAGVTLGVDVDDAICAVLGETAARIERSSGVRLDDGVNVKFGCPAIWTAEPRRRLAQLAGKAGFDLQVADILDEPIAAGVSWVMNRFTSGMPVPHGRVVVFDCGGGTLDVAVLEVRDGSLPEITVLSAAGRPEAGDALDATIADDLAVDLELAGIDIASHDRATELRRLLRLAAERLKTQLTPSATASTDIGADLDHFPTLSYERTRLEAVFGDQLNRAIRLVFACLRAAELSRRNSNDPITLRATDDAKLAEGVSYVLLVGGMSRVPAVGARLAGEFPRAAVETDLRLSPEESVVNGLTFNDVVSELNLHRPGFDFVIEFLGRHGQSVGEQIVYPAFTPLYQPEEVTNGQFQLGWSEHLRAPDGASHAQLTCVAVDGRRLDLHVNGNRQSGVPVRIGGNRQLRFKLYVDGQVLFSSAHKHLLRVERWPVLRSGLAQPTIGFRTVDQRADDQQIDGWWHGGE